MSLLPLLLSRIGIVGSPASSAMHAVGFERGIATRHGYSAGHRHQPVALSVAIGLPAALIITYMLNPQLLPPEKEFPRTEGVLIELPLPPPPPIPEPKPQPDRQKSVITAPTPPFTPPIAQNDPVDPAPLGGPITFDPGPVGPAIDPPLPPVTPIAKPVRTLASLDKRFADRFQPVYPGREIREEIEGRSKVRVLVGVDGRVKAVEDLGATSPGFFTETKDQALKKWRFKPATEDGKPIESWFTITVTFELKNV